MIERRRVRLAIYLAAAAVLMVGLAWLLWPKRSLDAEAERLARCLGVGDAACAMSFVSPVEVRAVLKSQDALRPVVEELVAGLPKVSYSIEPNAEARESSGVDFYTFSGRDGDRTVEFSLRIAYTDDGIKAPELLSALTMASWYLKGEAALAANRGSAKLKRLQSGMRTTRPRLTSLGMIAVMRRGEPQTWDDQETYYVQAIQHLDAGERSGSRGP